MAQLTVKKLIPLGFIKLIKSLIKPIHKFTVKLLHNSPISSEIIGPPKGFYISTKDWIARHSLDESKSQASYEEIYPNHQVTRLKPKTVDKDIHWQFRLQSVYEFPNTFVAVIPGGRVFGDKGVVITPDDQLLADVSIELGALSPEKANHHSIFRQLKLPSLTSIDKTVALLSVGGGKDIYFHWMFDLLPRIHLLRCSGIPINSIDNFIINKIHLPFQQETLSILGIPQEKIIESHNHFHIKAKKLVVPALPSIPGQVPKWVCEFLRKEFLYNQVGIKIDGWERVYISRAKAKHRRVINEEEVINFLDKLEFKTLILESMTVPEQALLFSSAKVIVAPHGGGLTNVVFCQPGTKIIEFFSPNYVIPIYWALATELGIEYYYLLGEGQSPKLPEDVDYYLQREDFLADLQKHISINIDSLAKLMKLAGVT